MSKAIWFFIGIVLLIGGVVLYNKVLHPKEAGQKGPGGKPAGPMSVNAFVAQPRTLENTLVASGTLLAYEEVELHPEVSGRITQLNLSEGASVSKGTLLVKLYDADLQAQLKKLKLQEQTAVKTEGRLKQLLAANGIGQQEYDNAAIQLSNIQADIEQVQAQITKTEIRAPFSGVVGLRNVSSGAYITPATMIATLQQIDPLKLDFTVPEKYSALIGKGDGVKFKTAGSDETFTAKVFAVEPRVDESTRTIKVRASVQNTRAKLYPGAFAEISLGLSGNNNALLIPSQCIIPQAREKKVIVANGGKAEFRTVETGIRNESYIEITKGLQAGDTIVTTALMYVKPGADLKITKFTE
jgi:membrane fusion protein, multidrug efflux system